jgi:hypothetical protein
MSAGTICVYIIHGYFCVMKYLFFFLKAMSILILIYSISLAIFGRACEDMSGQQGPRSAAYKGGAAVQLSWSRRALSLSSFFNLKVHRIH